MWGGGGHASKSHKLQLSARPFEGSPELGVIIYSVLYRAIKNSPNGVNCCWCPARGRRRGAETPLLAPTGGWVCVWGVFFDGKMRETRFRAPKSARLRLLRLWGQRARRSASAPAAVATRRGCRDGQRPRTGLGFSLGIGFAGDGEGGKELQKVTESPQQKGINGNKKK